MVNQEKKWDHRFLRHALEVSTWSKDPSTQVGAVICNELNQVLSIGYNGFPRFVPDDPKLLEDREVKLKLTVHAEGNAIVNAQGSVRGSTIYVYPFMPCSNCAGLVIQAGISRVVSVYNDTPRWQESFDWTRKLLLWSGVSLDLYNLEEL